LQKLWDELQEGGVKKLSKTVANFMDFSVKMARIIFSGQDLFSKEYTDALSGLMYNLDLMLKSLVKAVIKQYFMNPGKSFVEFDNLLLGAASVAKVH
jgi:predicted unusual protein kinase regulating ubiquinone biosynthesis (AarF/ABC1/UbiB family)